MRIGSSLANWLLPSKFKRPLVILLDGAVLSFREDFGSAVIDRGLGGDSGTLAQEGVTPRQGWREELLSFFKRMDWVKHFVWAIEMTDVTVRSSHFELTVEQALYESKWNEHVLTLENSYVKSLLPMTVDDINFDTSCHRILEVTSFKFVLNSIQNEHHYVFRDVVYGQWNPLFHLNVVNLVSAVKAIVRKVRRPSPQTPTAGERTAFLYFDFSGNVSVGLLLSNEGQTMELRASDFSVVRPGKQRLSIKSTGLSLFCDDNEIATLDVSSLA